MKEMTKAEEELMQILWNKEKAFVKEILEEYPNPKPAYNTISTIIRILEKKEFVGHLAFGKTHQYYPLVSKESYKTKISSTLLSKYFDGSVKNLVSFFTQHNKLDTNELDDIMKLIKDKKDA